MKAIADCTPGQIIPSEDKQFDLTNRESPKARVKLLRMIIGAFEVFLQSEINDRSGCSALWIGPILVELLV
jgi:hypothetical protein